MSHGTVIFAGTPDLAARCAESLVQAGTEIVAVLTRPDAPQGRKRTMTASPVAQWAESRGLPVIRADRVDEQVTAQIAELSPDLGVAVAYGALLPANALSVPRRGWVNLHYSDLPAYRGAAPVQHAMLHGESRTAATVFQLETGMDTGPVHGRVRYDIPELSSAGTVLDELTLAGSALLTELMPELLAGTSAPEPQKGEPSLAPKLQREDAYIDPCHTAAQIVHRVNATIPEPGAWTLHGGNRIKLGVVREYDGAISTTPGHVTSAPDDRAPSGQIPVLGAGDGHAVVLTQVQPAGKRMMNAADWLRGQQQPVIWGIDHE